MVGKSVLFTAEVTNAGQQPIANVVVSQQADAALLVTEVTDKAMQRGNEWVWSVPSVPPGRLRPVQVRCECKHAARNACCRFAVTLADGRSVEGRAFVEIAPAAPSVGSTQRIPPAPRTDR
jgi:uncharacterized repeat protein (TIGR01451 family)